MIKVNIWSEFGLGVYKPWVYNFMEHYQLTEFDESTLLYPLSEWGSVSIPNSPYISFARDEDYTLFLLRFS